MQIVINALSHDTRLLRMSTEANKVFDHSRDELLGSDDEPVMSDSIRHLINSQIIRDCYIDKEGWYEFLH